MTRLHWLSRLKIIPVLITIRKAWTMSDFRLGYLSYLNNHITFATLNHPTINSNDQTNSNQLKPGIDRLIPTKEYLNNNFNR